MFLQSDLVLVSVLYLVSQDPWIRRLCSCKKQVQWLHESYLEFRPVSLHLDRLVLEAPWRAWWRWEQQELLHDTVTGLLNRQRS